MSFNVNQSQEIEQLKVLAEHEKEDWRVYESYKLWAPHLKRSLSVDVSVALIPPPSIINELNI